MRNSFPPSTPSNSQRNRSSYPWPTIGSGSDDSFVQSTDTNWSCSNCGKENPGNVVRCVICSTPRPNTLHNPISQRVVSISISPTKPSFPAGTGSGRRCSRCSSSLGWKERLTTDAPLHQGDPIHATPVRPARPLPESIQSSSDTPITAHKHPVSSSSKPNPPIASPSIMRSPLSPSAKHSSVSQSPSIARSQVRFSPTSPEAVSPDGFPVLDPEAARTWMCSLYSPLTVATRPTTLCASTSCRSWATPSSRTRSSRSPRDWERPSSPPSSCSTTTVGSPPER